MADVDTSHIVIDVKPRQKATIVIVLLLVVFLMMQANFKIGILGMVLSKSTLFIVGASLYILGSLWVVEGRPMMNFRELIKGVPRESWWLTAVVMCLASTLTAADTGVSAFCVSILKPLLGGLSPWAFVAVVCIAAFIMTNVCNNIVVTVCMMPILLSMAPVIGFTFEAAIILVILCSHFALLTPAASGPAGLMFANKDWVALKDIYSRGLVLLLSCLFFTITVGYLWANVVF